MSRKILINSVAEGVARVGWALGAALKRTRFVFRLKIRKSNPQPLRKY
jgi:hypothetical protein